MTSTPERIMVAFEGGAAGAGELSWGQKENWATITALHDWFPLGGVTQLPADMTVEQIVDTLRYVMTRYPSLRTRLRFDEGRPTQVVHAAGQLPVELVDAGDADPGKVAETVAEQYRETELDFTAEWPLRMAAILSRGRPTHMVGLISHLAADAAGLGVMMREMATMDAGPVTGMPPLAQAAWQQSPAGRRHNAAAMRYWGEIFRTIGPDRFNEAGHGHEGGGETESESGATNPRYWHGEFDSPALLPAVRSIAAASGQGTSTIFLTLLAVALHQVNGINPVVVRPIVGNRFRPGLDDVVCTVAQAGICVLDIADVPFDVALRRAQRSVISAYKYAYFDHGDMTDLRARIEAERGVTFDTGLFINDRHDVGAMQAADRAAGRIVAAPSHPDADGPAPSTFRWVHGQDTPYERLFVEVDDIPGGFRISLHLDSQAVSLPSAQRLTQAMEAIAVAAARPDAAERA